MKKHLGDIILGLGIVVLAGIIWFQQSPKNTLAGDQFSTYRAPVTSANYPLVASTTAGYIGYPWKYINNATSTFDGYTAYAYSSTSTYRAFDLVDGTESIDWNIMVNASSTTSKLGWFYEFSDDGSHWFPEDATPTASGNMFAHSANYAVHTWTPGVAGTSTRNFLLDKVDSKYVRINVSGQNETSTSSMGIYIEAILKKPY